ncbi:MAG: hypothetical protein KatS3mg107_0960 [Gemmataceae bacterium]|nr:MAG: hypothetical protein KatS3mg107_0960 [Gemmataceae bacterium]
MVSLGSPSSRFCGTSTRPHTSNAKPYPIPITTTHRYDNSLPHPNLYLLHTSICSGNQNENLNFKFTGVSATQ